MKIICLVPPLHFPVNELGHGYHPPLGLLTVAGPLVDAGFDVDLLDADASHLSADEIIVHLKECEAHIVLVGHSGSMVANPIAIALMERIKTALPNVITVYGGVYATYACREILSASSAVDFIVCGEGEITTYELLTALQAREADFGSIAGLGWRLGRKIIINKSRPSIEDLDQFRVAWELANWSLYNTHQFRGRSAIVQFSRGCPLTCTYCGQWQFWRRWRHRSIDSFVTELEYLRDRCGVQTIWIADENWAQDRKIFGQLLETIVARKLNIHIFCAMTAKDVVRDADRIGLYRQAGITCLMMGVESFDDEVLSHIRKDNPYSTTSQAVSLLRQHGIFSVVNVIYGLLNENWRTMWHTLHQLRAMSPDFYNALHLTPLSWTAEGRATDLGRVIQLDQQKWDFRQPVIQPISLSPKALAIGVKLSEALFYLRPMWLLKGVYSSDLVRRQLVRDAFRRLVGVYLNERMALLHTTFARPGEALKAFEQLALLMPGITSRKSVVSVLPPIGYPSNKQN